MLTRITLWALSDLVILTNHLFKSYSVKRKLFDAMNQTVFNFWFCWFNFYGNSGQQKDRISCLKNRWNVIELFFDKIPCKSWISGSKRKRHQFQVIYNTFYFSLEMKIFFVLKKKLSSFPHAFLRHFQWKFNSRV